MSGRRYLCFMRQRLKAVRVRGNMNQIHVKRVDLKTYMLCLCVLLWPVPVGHSIDIIQPITINLS